MPNLDPDLFDSVVSLLISTNAMFATAERRSLLTPSLQDRPVFQQLIWDQAPRTFAIQLVSLLDHSELIGVLRNLRSQVGTDVEPKINILCKLIQKDSARRKSTAGQVEWEPALHQFDLEDLAEDCLEQIMARAGLIGFALSGHCDLLVHNLAKRVWEEARREAIFSLTKIHHINTVGDLRDIPEAIERLAKAGPSIAKRDAMCRAVVTSSTLARDLWTSVEKLWNKAAAEVDAPDDTRFILFMLVKNGDMPQGMVHLRAPKFRKHHLKEWWDKVSMWKRWRHVPLDEVLRDLVELSPTGKPELNMVGVYDHLDDAMLMLRDCADEEEFRAMWEIYNKESSECLAIQ